MSAIVYVLLGSIRNMFFLNYTIVISVTMISPQTNAMQAWKAQVYVENVGFAVFILLLLLFFVSSKQKLCCTH